MSITSSVFIAAIFVGAGVAAGWWITDKDFTAEIGDLNADHATALKVISDKAAAETADALAKQQAAEKSVAAIDAKYTQELTNAQSEIDTLRNRVAMGSVELLLNATCIGTGRGDTVSSGAATAGRTNAATPRLTDSAERNYFTLRERIGVCEKQIDGLQNYITTLQKSGLIAAPSTQEISK